jgi:hypothetical protein
LLDPVVKRNRRAVGMDRRRGKGKEKEQVDLRQDRSSFPSRTTIDIYSTLDFPRSVRGGTSMGEGYRCSFWLRIGAVMAMIVCRILISDGPSQSTAGEK